MTKIIPVSPETCADKYWQANRGYSFTASIQFAALVGAELAPAVQVMPLAFVRKDNAFMLTGLLSLESGVNLFVAPDGKWLGSYIPACFRGQPFRLAKSENGTLVLCVDEDSGLISESQGIPFFDVEGELSPATRQVLDFMQKVWNNTVATQRAVEALAQAELIVPWPLAVKVGQEEKRVAGIFRIDEARLNSLDDQTFLPLRKYLPIAYAQLFSMVNVNLLARMTQARAQAIATTKPSVDLDLDKLFGKNDDLISFGDS
jgi:hypothetical protein